MGDSLQKHEKIRLTMDGNRGGFTNGDVIAYFAPNFVVEPQVKTQVNTWPLADDDWPIGIDLKQFEMEVLVQGAFVDGDQLPDAHATDLQDQLGKDSVTWRDQVNRLIKAMTQAGPPFNFHDGNDKYTANTQAGVELDRSKVDGTHTIYPSVGIHSIKRTARAGRSNREYTIRLIPFIEA